MKRLIIFALSFSLISIGCKKEAEKKQLENQSKIIDTINIKPVKVQDNLSITYDLSENTKHKFKLTMYQKTIQTLQLDSLISGYVEQTADYFINTTVKEKEPNGNLTIDFFIEKVKVNVKSSSGESINFDSDNPPSDSLKRMQTKSFDVLSKANFSARISPTGEVLDIYRIDSIIDKIIQDAIRKPSTEERFQLTNDVSQGLLRPLILQIFKTMTDKKVNIDSVWIQNYPSQLSVFEIENTATYRVSKIFESNGNKIVEIEGNLNINAKGKQEHTEGNITYKFYKPKVSGISKTYFDLDQKVVRKSTADVSFEVVVDMQQKGDTKTYKRIEKILTKNTLLLIN